MTCRTKSQELFRRALRLMPGGVNSPVRAFKAVGGEPIFIASGRGSRVKDVDGSEYVDYVGSWGPLILGHCPPEVMESVARVLETGTSFGACTAGEVELAEEITKAMPSIERVRLVSSGTEATLSALRVARAATGRDKILKFEGCYHGHADSLLVKAGSGVATLGLPDSPGVPRALAELTLTVPFNDLEALRSAFDEHPGKIAAVIVEPVCGNMGCVPPAPGFLRTLRELTAKQGTVLIFDEVMTGFRVRYGGAQALYRIEPDLTTLGKIIGGGLPVGAYGGKAALMDIVAPAGPVYQAGTLSGNPVALAAGLKTLEILRRPGTYDRLEAVSAKLAAGLAREAQKAAVAACVNRVGSMLTMFFVDGPVVDFASAKKSHTAAFGAFFRSALDQGVYFPPGQFEAAFVSTAHTETDIETTLRAAARALSPGRVARTSNRGSEPASARKGRS
ncbi:MAG: glutamate-1-semialdehyde-2,1-aminomutase [Acidobacteria bacterium]|nr:MAG: glutamate-1-semialdehyde-2,1-aminomutase [Acidobacteriota bacterium]